MLIIENNNNELTQFVQKENIKTNDFILIEKSKRKNNSKKFKAIINKISEKIKNESLIINKFIDEN